MTKGLFALLMAGTLLAPHITPSLGNESIVKLGDSREVQPVDWSARLSAEFDKVPWLMFGFAARAPKSDLPIGSMLDTLAPFRLQPASPSTQFSKIWQFELQTTTE